MCYRYSQTKGKDELKNRYKAKFNDEGEMFQPAHHVNGFAHPLMPVITQEVPDEIQLYQWGPFNAFAAENEAKYNTLNAKCEEIFDKKSYKYNILNKRCIIPATGFFEWMHVQKEKYPFYIFPQKSEVFSMAGIYNSWKNSEGKVINSYSILTIAANPMMERIHNSKKRMPLIVPKELEREWLNEHLTPDEIKHYFLPYDQEEMNAHSIDKKILFTSDSNSHYATTKVEYPELALLM
ncbi:SOS response-associated peptidase [Solitalea lacus]|uniref:SOS response-associated peptidase n=1 Tax=Solitalea lacus TaxID=2911172 RepID=UPI001EDA1A82|nr:SOS response-associated peptidase [Solitalea lacus]UKJ09009.1 SOS response-associated peptidase [Solitalea lacus]